MSVGNGNGRAQVETAGTPEHDGYAHLQGPEPFTDAEALARFDAEIERLEDATFIDWPAFWAKDRADADWLVENVIARGRGHAIYAPAGSKKSLLLLWISARLATSPEPVAVVYLDYEMAEDDLYDRLEGMGYGPESDLSRLHYALLPDLPPLDTPAGTGAVSEILDRVEAKHSGHHLLVVIDTTARAVEGPENEADTFRRFSTATGSPLKRRGVTWIRADHTGKDLTKGQRGSAAKSDDPDLVWEIRETQNGIKLAARKRRMSWAPEWVAFAFREDPIRFEPLAEDWPAGTEAAVETLNRLSVPVEVSTREAERLLKSAGEGKRRNVIVAAQKWRRELGNHPGNHLALGEPEPFGEPPGKSQPVQGGNHPGNHREPPPEALREPGTPPLGGTGTLPDPPEPIEEELGNLADAGLIFDEYLDSDMCAFCGYSERHTTDCPYGKENVSG